MEPAQRKIGIVMYQYPLGVSTAIVNTIKELNQRGDKVILFIDEYSYYPAPLKYEHPLFSLAIFHDKRTFFCKVSNRIVREAHKFLSEVIFRKIADNINNYIKLYDTNLENYLKFVKLHINSSFTHLIAFELLGIAIAKEAVKTQKLIYYNLELLRYELCPDNRWRGIKKLEKNSLARVDHVIIPNAARAKAFSSENGYDVNRIEILPICNRGDSIIERTDYFRKKFSIPEDKLIVIYSTNIVSWAMCHEIIQSLHVWPKEFILVLHTWSKVSTKSKYYQDMVKLSKGLPVYFSTEFIDYDDLPFVLASADIALLFYSPYYRPGEENFEEIIASSNKLAEYLKATLPIIAHGVISLNDLVKSSKIGVYIDSLDKMHQALLEIKNNYDFYRRSCIECYNNQFRFDRLFDSIYKRIF